MTDLAATLRRRWPVVVLVVSLLLNGFFIGMTLVDWLRPHRGFSAERVATFELRRLASRLPQEAADEVAAAVRPLGPSLEERIARIRDMRAEILRLAAAPEPDRAVIDARLASLRAESAAMQEAVQKATYDALLRLPPADRAGLANPGKRR